MVSTPHRFPSRPRAARPSHRRFLWLWSPRPRRSWSYFVCHHPWCHWTTSVRRHRSQPSWCTVRRAKCWRVPPWTAEWKITSCKINVTHMTLCMQNIRFIINEITLPLYIKYRVKLSCGHTGLPHHHCLVGRQTHKWTVVINWTDGAGFSDNGYYQTSLHWVGKKLKKIDQT